MSCIIKLLSLLDTYKIYKNITVPQPFLLNIALMSEDKEKIDRTDDSLLCHYACIIHKFNILFFIKLCPRNYSIGNCVYIRCH